MKLQDYPRPKNDNGIGIHFRLDVTETNNKPFVSQGVEWLREINARWTLIAAQDWQQIGKAAAAVWAADVMPVCRLICKIDAQQIHWDTGVKMLTALGIPPYIQIFNEPGDEREWNKTPDLNKFGEKWADAAAIVFDAGGYPGVGAVLGKDEWLAAFNAVQTRGRTDIWNKAWFCLHNYGSNHPLNYPYDEVNQRGTPVSAQEYAQFEFSLPRDELNALRRTSAHPGATIHDDDTSILRFLEHKSWMVESLGFCLPMVGGEGGWEWGVEEDHRYPKLAPEQHAANHRAMFEWFRRGVLSNGDALPDELFSIAPWIMSDWGADDWWFGPLGTKQKTIDAVASIPKFTRKFSWNIQDTPAAPTTPRSTDGITFGQSPDSHATPVHLPSAESSSDAAIHPPTVPSADSSADTPAHLPTTIGTSETPTTSSETISTSAATSTPATPPADTSIAYIVQQGETLWGIAKKFGTTVDALVKANSISNRNRIRAGQKLIIPR